jgi:hypothetical protein
MLDNVVNVWTFWSLQPPKRQEEDVFFSGNKTRSITIMTLVVSFHFHQFWMIQDQPVYSDNSSMHHMLIIGRTYPSLSVCPFTGGLHGKHCPTYLYVNFGNFHLLRQIIYFSGMVITAILVAGTQDQV